MLNIPENVLLEYIRKVAKEDYRPVCYKDCECFEYEGKEYKMTHGTFRNKISKLKKQGKIQKIYHSNMTFYGPSGYRVGKVMTENDTGVSHNSPLYQLIHHLSIDKSGIHNIRLKFNSKNIWNVFNHIVLNKCTLAFNKLLLPYYAASIPNTVNEKSKDINFRWNIRGCQVILTIHKTDTVTVIIGCSYNPFRVDLRGLANFRCVLSIIEERISDLVNEFFYHYKEIENSNTKLEIKHYVKVPWHEDWIVTMWHHGSYTISAYSGEKFSISIRTLEKTVYNIYVKEFPGKKKEEK